MVAGKINVVANRACALFVFVVSLVVYLLTMAPSIALWDCGEFLAASASLGIPHPPGTPLLDMIGRFFFMVFSFVKDGGYRVNLIAAIGSALVAMFIFLIIVRTLTTIAGEPDTLLKRIAVYGGGVLGGLFCAFSNTFWWCAVEASEQSNVCLLPVVVTIWLALVWSQSKHPKRDRILMLITYIAYCGIGMHMISMITLPMVFLFIMFMDKDKRRDWRLWVSGVVLAMAMYNLSWFIIACLLVLVVTGLISLVNSSDQRKWRFCFFFALFAMLGFSNHLYMPIRSSLNPIIDEDHPVTWKAFTETLDRKQYGSESMVSRSFWRRGTFGHQFGIEGNMGYGGFHLTQFFHLGDRETERNFFLDGAGIGFVKLFVYLLPTFFMFFGWYYCYKRNRAVAVMLVGVILLTTLVLAWYMNFSDGTRAERLDYQAWESAGKPGAMPVVHREVRVRDYFFNAGFMFYGMWIGIASACLLLALYANKNKMLRTVVSPILTIVFAVSPLLPLFQNYAARDRHRNLLPYDYAYNLLMSCEKNGLLITNGDNDTFPLWAAQEAFGIRRDVRVINLSLLNTDWYIKQLKTVEPKVPISLSSAQIDQLSYERNPFSAPTTYTLPGAGISVVIPGAAQQNVIRTQDKMVLNIVDVNKWQKPVYFAITVSEDNFMGLNPYLQMQGMVFRVMQHPVSETERINPHVTDSLINKVYRFRNLNGPGVSLDEPARGLLANYSVLFLQGAFSRQKPLADLKAGIDSLMRPATPAAGKKTAIAPNRQALLQARQKEYQGMLDTAIGSLDRGASLLTDDWRFYMVKAELLMMNDRLDQAQEAVRQGSAMDPGNTQFQQLLYQINAKKNARGLHTNGT